MMTSTIHRATVTDAERNDIGVPPATVHVDASNAATRRLEPAATR